MAVAPAASDLEELEHDAERQYAKLCRMILHGVTASGGDIPRAALITSIREQHNLRKN
jgi:hypothetical protein